MHTNSARERYWASFAAVHSRCLEHLERLAANCMFHQRTQEQIKPVCPPNLGDGKEVEIVIDMFHFECNVYLCETIIVNFIFQRLGRNLELIAFYHNKMVHLT